ncbi:MAG TPA: hypothetical protein VE641_19485 [Chthoniobacterales bacterium]|nr:hypothetical protein [Chthoniobacterales bacterium]
MKCFTLTAARMRENGRIIAALYKSDLMMKLTGRALIGAKLGVTDIDGSAPLSYRYELGGPPEKHATLTS